MEVAKVMLASKALGIGSVKLVAAMTATLVFLVIMLGLGAGPAAAQAETLTVVKTGVGTVTSEPAGINCGDDCSEPYPSSTEEICEPDGPCRTITTYQSVTLTAAPAPGWALQGWSGDCVGTAATCSVMMNGNKSVNATFTRISPPNDDFASAQPISGAGLSVSGTTKDATRETGEPDHSSDSWSGDHTVWYRWTAPHTGDWTVDTCLSAIDSILAVYAGTEMNTITRLANNNNHADCSQNTFGSKLSFRATAGATYRIVVGGAGGAQEGAFTLALAPIPAPPNDNFDNAQLVNGASASVNGTNVSATREGGDPWNGTTNADRSVWYRWTAPFSGSATLDTCATNFDTLLSVSTSRSFGLVNSANNGCPSGFGDRLAFSARRDQTYYFGVDGCCGAPQGTFTIALNLVDDVLPDTRITQGPDDGSATSNTSLTFAFDADEPGSTFECRVYPAALTPPAFDNCSGAGTHTASGFSPGTYSFEVRATDTAGNRDATPAKRTFTVDLTAPETSIASGPSGTVRSTSASFDFFSGETGAGYECKLDGGEYAACTPSKSYSGLSNGIHTFSVRAKDAAGNVDATPATRRWTVDVIGPAISGMSPGPGAVIRDTTPTIGATVRDNATNLQKANISMYVAGRRITRFSYNSATDRLLYTSPRQTNGKKTVRVVARDAAGNVGAKSWYFTIR